ncbi:glycerophosphodiester phosphodiesterase [Effusibacillus consociatus]|uniref:Glycerophosphodiester phosphodiesterase n=1 Tax=Effusibacillus consociatus TaxID=1117041 RepID=A0ABV9PXB4_9BACL
MNPLIYGHRGASAYAPENTISAFRLAQEMGCHGLEFDVQLTKDGIPVVIHDEKMDRTTDKRGQVSTYTWNGIQSADAGSWKGKRWKGEKIPSLEEVLAEFNGMYLNIELKNSEVPYPGLEEKVVSLIDSYCDSKKVIVSSFNHESVRRIKKLAPHIRTGTLYDREPANLFEYLQSLGGDAVHPSYRLVTKEKVEQFHKLGFQINTWTVNRAFSMKRILQMGVDGIITNYPDRLKSLITTNG